MNKEKEAGTNKLAIMGLLLAVAMILSYVEYIIPINFTIPGMKLGLANLAVVLSLYKYGSKEALTINILRIILSGFMFGNLAGILFSIAGALVSFLVMLAMKRCDILSISGVSICGGVAHNAGQLIIAAFVVKTSGILYYLPFLLLAGMGTGFLIGIIAAAVLPYLKKIS